MSDREKAAGRGWTLAAPRPGSSALEMRSPEEAIVSKGNSRGGVRMRIDALPFKSSSLHHVVAVGVVWATGSDHLAAFREVQRVLRDEGNFVHGEADVDGSFAKDHLALREMGMVPAPMDTIPELSHVPWRLLVAFKPLTKSQATAERGHETH